MSEFKKNAAWAAAFAGLIALSAFVMLMHKAVRGEAKTAQISLNGQVVRTVELEANCEPYEFTVDTPWGKNSIRVENGRIGVVGADCPDKLCAERGFIGSAGESIVCLPHKLIITVSGSGSPDAVTGG